MKGAPDPQCQRWEEERRRYDRQFRRMMMLNTGLWLVTLALILFYPHPTRSSWTDAICLLPTVIWVVAYTFECP